MSSRLTPLRGSLDQGQRIDVVVLEPDALRQPFGEKLERHHLAAGDRLAPLLLGEDGERMQGAAIVAALLLELIGGSRFDPLVLEQPVEELGQGQPVVGFARTVRIRAQRPSELPAAEMRKARHEYYRWAAEITPEDKTLRPRVRRSPSAAAC